MSNAKLPTGRCRSCGAPILWARMKNTGRAIPLDEKPTPDGNLWASQKTGPKGIELVVHFAPDKNAPRQDVLDRERRRWVSHFATCPNATKHRRGS